MNINKQYLDPDTPAQNIYGLHLNVKRNNNISHTHNYHEFMLITSGSVLHKANGESDILSEHTLCFIRSNDIHSVSKFGDDDAKIFNVGIPINHFNKAVQYYDVDSTFLFSSNKPINVSLTSEEYNELNRKIDIFSKIEYGELHGKLFKNLLSELLLLLIIPRENKLGFEYSSNIPNWLQKLINDMRNPEYFIEGLPKLLSLTNYSQEYVTRSFRKHINMSPTQFLNFLKLSYAKKLIVEENLPIIDACFQSGFNCEGYFYKEFKKMYSMTPKQMLKMKETTK